MHALPSVFCVYCIYHPVDLLSLFRRLAAKNPVPQPPVSAGSYLYYEQKSQLYADYRADGAGPSLRHSRPLLTSHRLMGPPPPAAPHHGKLFMQSAVGGGGAAPFQAAGLNYRSDRFPSSPATGNMFNADDGFMNAVESPRYVEHIYESPTCVRKNYEVCNSTASAASVVSDLGCGSAAARTQQQPHAAGGARADFGQWSGNGDGCDSSAGSMQYYEIDPNKRVAGQTVCSGNSQQFQGQLPKQAGSL